MKRVGNLSSSRHLYTHEHNLYKSWKEMFHLKRAQFLIWNHLYKETMVLVLFWSIRWFAVSTRWSDRYMKPRWNQRIRFIRSQWVYYVERSSHYYLRYKSIRSIYKSMPKKFCPIFVVYIYVSLGVLDTSRLVGTELDYPVSR